MNLNMTIFRSGDNILPTLYWDMILVQYVRPILFTCRTAFDQLYIFSCYQADATGIKWLAARTTEEKLIQLLKNEIEIHDMFFNEDKTVFLVEQAGATEEKTVERKLTSEVPAEIFPSSSYYLEAEDDEYSDEIRELKERMEKKLLPETENIALETLPQTMLKYLFSSRKRVYTISGYEPIDVNSGDQDLSDRKQTLFKMVVYA